MIKKVLVTLDGSPLAEAVIPHAEDIAIPLGAELIFLRVVPPIPARAASIEIRTRGYSAKQLIATVVEEAKNYLKGVEERSRSRGANSRSVVVEGMVIDTILRFIDEEDIDIVAISTHGHSGITRLIVGSVAGVVMRRANIPVLMLRSREEEE